MKYDFRYVSSGCAKLLEINGAGQSHRNNIGGSETKETGWLLMQFIIV